MDQFSVSFIKTGVNKHLLYKLFINNILKKDFAIDYNGEIAKLTINDAYYEDTGDYTCEIWNEHGQQTSQFKITVKGTY